MIAMTLSPRGGDTFSLAAANINWPAWAIFILAGGVIGALAAKSFFKYQDTHAMSAFVGVIFTCVFLFWSTNGLDLVQKIPTPGFKEKALFETAAASYGSYDVDLSKAHARKLNNGEYFRLSVAFFLLRENDKYEFVYALDFEERTKGMKQASF